MKVLLVHNYYGSAAPSGEDVAFERDEALLTKAGHDVFTFVRRNDDLRRQGIFGAIRGGLSTPWNYVSANAIRALCRRLEPHVVHVHNTFPQISPAIFSAIGPGPAKVLTLHNYRLFCPAAVATRAGVPCTLCMDRHNVLPSIRYGCYRGSRAATVPLAVGVALHRTLGTWSRRVDAFLALSAFQRDALVRAGLQADKVHLGPGFFPDNPRVVPWAQRQDHVVFVGRLSGEKGILTLLRAWKAMRANAPRLIVIGDGPLRSKAEELARGSPVQFFGQLPSGHAHAEIARAKLLVLPSESFEAMPMVLIEAFAFGTPVAASAIGSLSAAICNGRCGPLLTPSDSQQIADAVLVAWTDPDRLQAMGAAARAEFEKSYGSEAAIERLEHLYLTLLEGKRVATVAVPVG